MWCVGSCCCITLRQQFYRGDTRPQTCACVDLSVELNVAALEVLRSSVERAAEEAKEAVRAQLLRELDAEEEVRPNHRCFDSLYW